MNQEKKLTSNELWIEQIQGMIKQVIGQLPAKHQSTSGISHKDFNNWIDRINNRHEARVNQLLVNVYHFENTRLRVVCDLFIKEFISIQDEAAKLHWAQFRKRRILAERLAFGQTLLRILVNTPPPVKQEVEKEFKPEMKVA